MSTPPADATPGPPGGDFLFTFAVIADTHLEPDPGGAASPRSNRRSRHAVRHLVGEQPAFVLHLGDLVHPVPALPGFEGAALAVRELLAELECPAYLTPGNHDIGDKSIAWMPAKAVSAAWIGGYERWFGAPYQAFDHGGCRFVLFNSPALGSGLPFEAEQRTWLERELAAHAGSRLFLATHYPPYLLRPDEPGHYDNLEPLERAWLLGLMERYRVEALFCGHVHNFFYNRHRDTHCYALPSPSFVRRDYAELFRVAPAEGEEFGRNETGRLGYFLVDVYESGHLARPVPTGGSVEERPCRPRTRLRPLHPAEAPRFGPGVHLRHPWQEVVHLPYNAPTDEFQRRAVRNDHPLMALWQLGVAHLRVPAADLADPASRVRLAELQALGQRFTAFSAGAPREDEAAALERHAGLLAGWEVVLPPAAVETSLAAIAPIRRRTGLPITVAPLTTSGADLGHGPNLGHFAWAGFAPGDEAGVADLLALPGARECVDRLGFRIGAAMDPWEGVAAAASRAAAHGLAASATVCLAPEDPSETRLDEAWAASRVAVTVLAAAAHPEVAVLLDTFMDVDRGYFVRSGLVDRRATVRLAGRVLAHAQAALGALPAGGTLARQALPDGAEFLHYRTAGSGVSLLLPGHARAPRLELLPTDYVPDGPDGRLQVVSLDTGVIAPLRIMREGVRTRVAPSLDIDSPALLGDFSGVGDRARAGPGALRQ